MIFSQSRQERCTNLNHLLALLQLLQKVNESCVELHFRSLEKLIAGLQRVGFRLQYEESSGFFASIFKETANLLVCEHVTLPNNGTRLTFHLKIDTVNTSSLLASAKQILKT